LALKNASNRKIQQQPFLEFAKPENEPGTSENPRQWRGPSGIRRVRAGWSSRKTTTPAIDFDRLTKIGEYFENEEFNTKRSSFRQAASF